ncbi:MAG: hypothetical protein LAO23_24150 [Acidobacteriia bacterium]|nr:hypothetical protein [Terriglobia bacterium]
MTSIFKPRYRVVEVSKPRPESLEVTPELREGLRTLNANPFMKVIMARLQQQRFALEAALKGTRFAKTEDIAYVQQGVFWTGWLERELNRLTEAPEQPGLSPTQQEEELFREVDSMLERVGIEPPQTAE